MTIVMGAAILNRGSHSFIEPADTRKMASDDPLFSEVISTRAFQRLKEIRFLGGIDYLLVRSPNGAKGNIRHTRYQHSLGVALLAYQYANYRNLPDIERRTICLAALLHDIGHAPLSHSLEPVFKEFFNIEHHSATESIITGRVPLGIELYETLRSHQVDVERVLELISGETAEYEGFFDGPINFDTVEGILRSRSYNSKNVGSLSAESVIRASSRRRNIGDRDIVDDFWRCKNDIYKSVINSQSGVLADFACQMFMRDNINRVKMENYFSTENHMFRLLPGLRELLTSRTFENHILSLLDRPISFKARNFYVDSHGDFFLRQDKLRYRQRRIERFLPPKRMVKTVDVLELERGLFDEDSLRSCERVFRK